MSITIYHNPRCSKSRETLALVQGKARDITVVEYLKTPPSIAELTEILGKLGKPAAQIIRAKEAREAGLDIAAMSESQLIAAMATNPALIERPIVVTATAARLGRPPDQVLEIL